MVDRLGSVDRGRSIGKTYVENSKKKNRKIAFFASKKQNIHCVLTVRIFTVLPHVDQKEMGRGMGETA